ncbi:endonuclease domain-containing protein [Sphingomonas sp. S2-65]|uniref:endonuclease domain-containing protein n=1 Tax=Sphingomonas sp. S2-65 TaxID=2903960 RepID=UPI001F36B4DB|nr:endonuclease domain-containing protein [Sphingomonas sp. S2-65]UYY59817.1 endonuclease domain-containing protein [Sphingomonas sp. S2-65]
MLHGPKRTQVLAKRLRRNLSLPEALLWRELRKRPSGLKFRKQHPAGPYVLDFFCAGSHLAVEVDGEAHERGDSPVHDAARDAWLNSQGVRVCRILAADVLADMDAVVRHIVFTARGDYPSTSFASPLPPPGEE